MLHDFILDLDDFKEIKKIGESQFQFFYLIREKKTNIYYTARINKSKNTDQVEQYQFLNEVKQYMKVKYPTLIKFYGYNLFSFDRRQLKTVIFEFTPNGSLANVFQQEPEKWTLTVRYIEILGIALGMKFL